MFDKFTKLKLAEEQTNFLLETIKLSKNYYYTPTDKNLLLFF